MQPVILATPEIVADRECAADAGPCDLGPVARNRARLLSDDPVFDGVRGNGPAARN